MLTIDMLGLFLTVLMVSIRYPHYVIIAAFVHDIGMIIMTLFINGQVEAIITAGAFSALTTSGISGAKAAVIAMTGPLVNYTISALIGGSEFEKTANLINPFVELKHPFAVVNVRLALISLIFTLWQIYWN